MFLLMMYLIAAVLPAFIVPATIPSIILFFIPNSVLTLIYLQYIAVLCIGYIVSCYAIANARRRD